MADYEIAVKTSSVILYLLIAVFVLLRARAYNKKREPLLFLAITLCLGIKAALIGCMFLQMIATLLIFCLVHFLLSFLMDEKRKKILDVSLMTAFLTVCIVILIKPVDSVNFRLFYSSMAILLFLVTEISIFRLYKTINKKVILFIMLLVGIYFIVSGSALFLSEMVFIEKAGGALFYILLAGAICYLLFEDNYLVRGSLKGLTETLFREKNQAQKAYQKLATAEETLIDQERLVSIGALAGGLVHEFKNILCLISASAQYGISNDALEKKQQSLSLIREHVQFSMDSVIGVLDQIRSQKRNEPQRLALKDFLAHFTKMVKANYRANGIDITLQAEQDAPLLVRKADLEQILLNLVRNAVNALLKNDAVREKWINVRLSIENEQPLIMIRDNAGGIDESTAVRLFELHDAASTATGIGLYLSKMLAEKNNLLIEYSSEGSESCFKILSADPFHVPE